MEGSKGLRPRGLYTIFKKVQTDTYIPGLLRLHGMHAKP